MMLHVVLLERFCVASFVSGPSKSSLDVIREMGMFVTNFSRLQLLSLVANHKKKSDRKVFIGWGFVRFPGSVCKTSLSRCIGKQMAPTKENFGL